MTRAADVDAGFVQSKLKMGAGWGAIARMAGCSEADLRRHHDPAAPTELLTLTRCAPASPRDQVARHLRGLGFGPDEATIAARLWFANGADVSSEDLARGIAGGGALTTVIRDARQRLTERLGIVPVRAKGRIGWRLNHADVVAIGRAAGLGRSEP
jgi:hypothetical protein